MAIINNEPCPSCQKMGHDQSGNHLMVFEDNGKYCNRSHFHESREPLYIPPDGESSILDSEITGKIKYTPKQFRELEKGKKLNDPMLRTLALGGMRNEDRWEVMTEAERAVQQAEWDLDVAHFETLKVKSLIDRHIHGSYAKLYNVRVGHDASGKVARHYYPSYEQGKLVGAKCRTLPKEFFHGHLGKNWGDLDLFGQHTTQAVIDSGRKRMDTLLLVGGECDAMAAQEMLCESQAGGKYAGQLFHVWSVTKGESSVDQIRARKSAINAFSKIILGFDNDATGMKLMRETARLFPGKCVRLQYPNGCKDANDCLKQRKVEEFVNAWWHPVDLFAGSQVKNVAQIKDELKKGRPAQGLSTPWPTLTKYISGFRPNLLITVAAGPGVGKTEALREITEHLIEVHQEPVGVISTEDPYKKVALSYIGKFIDKRIELPPTNDKSDPEYREVRDYTEEQADTAIDKVAETGLLYFAALDESNKMSYIMEQIQEFMSLGIRHIILDNLTGIEGSESREMLDENMKILGRYKDSEPVCIFLVSHLSKPQGQRVPFENGGEVYLSDLRGSGAIGMWSSYVIAFERNTKADTLEEKTLTRVRMLKDRDQAIYNGATFYLVGDESTGRLREPSQRRAEPKPSTRPDSEESLGTTQGEKAVPEQEF